MRHLAVMAGVLLSACSSAPTRMTATPAQPATPQTASPAAAAPMQPAVPAPAVAAAEAAPPVSDLGDLETMTLGCPKAGLNAAAREAARARAQGRYQFSYFRIISDSHHALYEVRFTSNDHEDPELKYCVSIYCQQGWDPRNTKVLVTPMGEAATPDKTDAAGAAHGGHCGMDAAMPAKPRSKKR
ncbi:MAG: hypothetical protein JNK68_14910 [Betaproteobacteria bacterium]|nr:hypothetical protein [Betaproteobacteria bacterium]